jgi:hypothetical protein
MALAIGIIGTLLGVVVGAFVTRWVDFHYERRREIRQAITSALILREELNDAQAGISACLKKGRGSSTYSFAGIEDWEEHRESLLVAGMAHEDWSNLARIFRRLLEMAPLLQNPDIEIPDEYTEFVQETAHECEGARDLLQPFITESPLPFFSPGRALESDANSRST